nr:dihydroxyacetone kinase subunit DhaK [uncultured Blautia sp.]
MRKIMNKADRFVYELCNGIAMTNPLVTNDERYKIIRRKDLDPGKVTLISGGGSGHEPAHAGYVGKGMLDAAVCGDIFASPTQIQVYKAIEETKSEKGTLLIIKNYSGDLMNFKNGAALAEEEGIEVKYVVVSDDIAVKDSLYTVGQRGVAGTVLVHKIAGAAAEEGCSLEEVQKVAAHAADSVKSIGFAFSSCVVPAKGSPTFQICDGEMEYGVGIHGEPGIQRETSVTSRELAARMTSQLLKALNMENKGEIAILINGFGGTALQELYVVANDVRRELDQQENITVYRSFVGNYMTSIDMMGASLTIMKLDESLKHYLDCECYAPAFRVDGPVPVIPFRETDPVVKDAEFFETEDSWKQVGELVSLENIKYMVAQMGQCIIDHEVPFCTIDSYAGDGDFGASVAKGFRQLRNEWLMLKEKDTIEGFLKACGMIIIEYCGGASGPIWGSAFMGAGKWAKGKESLSLGEFGEMMEEAVRSIQRTGERSFGRGAVVGDKTLIDALVPYADTLVACGKKQIDIKEAFKEASAVAVKGAKETEKIVARMGRAGVVGERSLGHPDAGAYALGVIFSWITEALK